MFDPLVQELSERYGLGDRGRDLFALLVAYIHNDRRGGFGGFVEGFREQGQGELLASWLGNPEAGGLNASEVGTVFGQGLLNDWGTRLGASRATVAAAIAGVLPRLVAELTPGGRIPGGFAPPPLPTAARTQWTAGPEARERLTDVGAPAAALQPERPPPPDDVPAWAAAQVPMPARDAAGAIETGERDPGRIVPADARRTHAPEVPASMGLRRDPRDPRDRTEPAVHHDDPGERRIADMAQALEGGPARRDASAAMRAERRPDGWKPAVHPPPRRSRWGWWLLLLLLLAAAGVAWAWQQGLLAPWLQPYIDRFQLPILPAPSTT